MEKNQLYPVFLKVTALNTLIVGGGNVALEKLSFLLKSSPDAKVTMISPFYREETIAKAKEGKVRMVVGNYDSSLLEGKHIVIATTDIPTVNLQVYNDCKERAILVNLADNPPYCDFYMGGIVTKGNVKIGISTNGKSPTMAKRLRQFFESVLPDNIDDLAEYLNKYRDTIKGNFEEKVEKMNEFTKGLVGDVKDKIKE
ncbi:bifunctional precorrin-2 dehydrogenase/sirohydrochlorin ferrochelatase [Wenyingzhuangia sp. 2_MG-2023]|uniref:precorrin-2 dehydrogenase/sirohydrochlorin ferrochelatase family protein n=1 Tax=Wenyingzhuangia sp. 2_MG-2023 TaxID=3062639 RepID=UPI0026E39268|nr:bifunctional precorrin-2 dehydrogenase/sirohydrochlorin ferrochelatase [Wenyingzhuangia sp. 2_MG-2023]MDO6737975.1 bifunctional precorrin-2 dehydrogenase/sirohydrochlorin ferrochelatase [Wenyingzhuangia sp. 2_MG-2023]